MDQPINNGTESFVVSWFFIIKMYLDLGIVDLDIDIIEFRFILKSVGVTLVSVMVRPWY